MNITQEELLELFEYKDGKLFWKVAKGKRGVLGAEAGSIVRKYKCVGINKKQHRLHRVIFMMHHGFLPQSLDHINNNTFDNRIENLRPATLSENNQNQRIRKTNTSGVKGVCWRKKNKTWQVEIKYNGKKEYLGCFKDIELAELVAIEARDKRHGKFANHG